jgi:hypothetical protein
MPRGAHCDSVARLHTIERSNGTLNDVDSLHCARRARSALSRTGAIGRGPAVYSGQANRACHTRVSLKLIEVEPRRLGKHELRRLAGGTGYGAHDRGLERSRADGACGNASRAELAVRACTPQWRGRGRGHDAHNHPFPIGGRTGSFTGVSRQVCRGHAAPACRRHGRCRRSARDALGRRAAKSV